MLDKHLAMEALDAALSTGGDFAEIFAEDRRDQAVALQDSHVERVNSGRLHGAGVRVYDGTSAVYAYTNDFGREGLLKCAKEAASAIRAQRQDRTAVQPMEERHFVNRHPIWMKPSEVDTRRKIDVLRAADKAARSAGDEISQVLCAFTDSEQNVLICNSEGLYVADTRVYSRLRCQAVASNGTENQSAGEAPGAARGFDYFLDTIDPALMGLRAGKTAVKMLHAPFCPSGVMPVVIGSGFGGVIFHEACGHSLEATAVASNMSEFCGKLGQQIAAPCVTAIDDGTLPNEWGSENVDDEGMPTNRLVLIENGILKNYMIDRLNGRRMGMAPTGSARRESYAYAPTSRMRNTFIAPGCDDEAEMIATMGDGLYAASMGGGSVNPATGEFNFAVNEGYLIKDGKIAHPVRGASLVGKGGGHSPADRPGRQEHGHGSGHVRQHERLRSRQRRPALDPRQVHHGRRQAAGLKPCTPSLRGFTRRGVEDLQVGRGFTAVARRVPRLAGLVSEMLVGRKWPPLGGRSRARGTAP
ncbi:MAG: TldD/PmbA family protein [Lachnospiraceae bacterium]